MKASIAHGIRPSALLLGKDSHKPWGRTDIALAKAYQRFLNELCKQCGLPKYLCHNDDNRIQFKLAHDECAATAVSDRAQYDLSEKARKNPNAPKQFGMNIYSTPFLTQDAIADGMEFSDFRYPYLKLEAEKAGLIPQSDASE
jgi:hypothetical protein